MTKINNTKDRLLFNALINSSNSDDNNLIYFDISGVKHVLPLNKRSPQITNFFKAIVASNQAYPKGLGDKMDTYNRVSKTTFVPKTTSDSEELDRLFKPIEAYAKEAIEISPRSLQFIKTPTNDLRNEINHLVGANKTSKSDPPQPKPLPSPELGRVMGPPSTQEQIDETLEAITKVLKGDQPERKKQVMKEVNNIVAPPEIKPTTSPIQVERKEVEVKPETVETYLEDTYQTSKEGETGGFRDPEKELKIINELYVQQRALDDIRTADEIIAAGHTIPDELREDLNEIDLSRTGQNTEIDIATIPLPVQTELLVKEQNLGNLPKKLESQFLDLPQTPDKHKALKDKLNRVFAATKPAATDYNKQNYTYAVNRIIDKLYDLEPVRNNGMTDQEVFDYVTGHLFNRIYEEGYDADERMIEARNDFIKELKYYYGEDVYQDIENDMNYFQGAVTLQGDLPLSVLDSVDNESMITGYSNEAVPEVATDVMIREGIMGPNPPDDIVLNTGTAQEPENKLSEEEQLLNPQGAKYGTKAVYHKIPIKLVFNSSDNPEWDPVLESAISETEISNKEAFDIMGPLVDMQGSKIMINSLKTSMKDPNNSVKKELNEILQLWFSVNRNMSKGPRVPKAGISLGSLMGSGSGYGNNPNGSNPSGYANNQSGPPSNTNQPPKVDIPPQSNIQVTDKMVADAWKNSHYQYGFGNSGPKDFLPRPRMTEPKRVLKAGTAEVPDKPFAKLRFKVDLNKC